MGKLNKALHKPRKSYPAASSQKALHMKQLLHLIGIHDWSKWGELQSDKNGLMFQMKVCFICNKMKTS